MCWVEVTWLERARTELHLIPLGSPGCGPYSAVPAWNRPAGGPGTPSASGAGCGERSRSVGSTGCSLPAYLQAVWVGLLMCQVSTSVMITWETAGREFWAESRAELGQINCNYFKVLSTFNDWQGFGLCHQIFKYRYVFFLQLGTWILG